MPLSTLIGERVRAGETVHEHDIAQFIRDQFDRRGLYIDHGPTVAVNEHSGDPHYAPLSRPSYAHSCRRLDPHRPLGEIR